jgi:DNA-directed RNA polymerase subunit RPC12/RpoP
MPDLKTECPNCGQSIEFPEEMVGQVSECPTCNTKTYLVAKTPETGPPILVSPAPPVIPNLPPVQMVPAQAFIERKSSFVGVGCLVQGLGILGLLAFPLFPFSTVAGVVLLIVGGRLAIGHACSQCKGKVESTARLCQHCGSQFVQH